MAKVWVEARTCFGVAESDVMIGLPLESSCYTLASSRLEFRC